MTKRTTKTKTPRILGADTVGPVRGGVATRRAHDLSGGRPKGPAPKPDPNAGELTEASALPPLYAGWVRDFLPGGVPSEPNASCDDCAMELKDDRPRKNEPLYFGPATKCCTIVPNLPNFLVGRILDDQDPAEAAAFGRRTVLERIATRAAVTPLGLGRTLGFALHYRHHGERFGQSLSMRCPHYVEEGGLCGVWKHRESTCATWFCKYERGAVSVRFWRSLHVLLGGVEHELSYWAAKQIGLDTEAVLQVYQSGSASLSTKMGTFASHLLDGQLDGRGLDRHPLGPRPEAEQRALWGEWSGRETELYALAARLVSDLPWSRVEAIVGRQLSTALAEVRDAYAHLRSTAVPGRLASRSEEIELVQIGKTKACADTYRAFDPQSVPRALLDVLPHFDGRPTDEAIEVIAKEAGLRLEPALVRKLVDFGLLVETE